MMTQHLTENVLEDQTLPQEETSESEVAFQMGAPVILQTLFGEIRQI